MNSTTTSKTEIQDIIAAVPTNVESPVPSQPRLRAIAYERFDIVTIEAVCIRIQHTRFDKEALDQINAYKRALVAALKAAGYSVYKVKRAGLRFLYCSSIGQPKDGLAWDLEIRRVEAA